jgi:molecular chaperone GrpE
MDKKKDHQKAEVKDNKVEILEKEKNDFKDKYLRALADYQNFEKRINEEKNLIRNTANRNLILKLLPFLDNLEKAEIFIKDDSLKMIRDSFYRVLNEAGVKEINISGKEFDPNFAEVVDVVEGEKDNVVVEVLRKGYMLNGQVIRIAQVKVSKKIIKS